VTKKAAPPGWAPHVITHRVDGWIADPENENRIPAAVAQMVRAMPQLGDDTVSAIYARMLVRHRKVVGSV
jgi:hypothetical protein